MIETVDDLIEALGGTFAVAAWLTIVPSAVSNWRRENAIPTGWHLRLYLEAERRGLVVNRSLFGIMPVDPPPDPSPIEAHGVMA